MKKKLRGFKRQAIELDFNLYRVDVPIPNVSNANLSVIDLWPEAVERTILFIHGYAGCAETWEYQINHFARNYRVVIPDLRGHGQSDAPFTEYTMPELVDDIHAIAKHLEIPERFILVGHSFGGSICVEYANAHPERLEKLVLIATAGEYPLPRIANLLARIPLAFYRLWWDYRPKWNAEIHVMKRMMFNNLRKWKGWSKLRNIKTETLVITGERDTYFPRYVFDDAAKMVPDAEIYDVGSAKHKVQLERADAVNRVIERFIDTTRSKSSWRTPSQRDDLAARRPWLSSYSKGTAHTIPIPREPLHMFLESAADWVPKRTAIHFKGHALTYAQLQAKVNRFASALHGMGIHSGDRVILYLPNSPEFIIAFYAIVKVGGVVVLPNPGSPPQFVVEAAQQTDANVLISVNKIIESVQPVIEDSPLKHIIIADLYLPASESVRAPSMERLTEDAPDIPPNINVKPDDLATVIFTSGTTDVPRGVCLTHANLVANALQTRHWVPDLEFGKEIFLSVIPFSHSYGLTGGLNIPIAIGATLVVLPEFDLQTVLEHIKQHKPTIFPGVPAMYTAINQAPNVRAYGLSSIKACISGATALPVEVQEAFEKLTRGRLVEGYGLTECSPITHANPPYGFRKVGSIGVPIPNTDARIVDLDTGEPVDIGEIGELIIQGPQVMQGYWGDEDGQDTIIKDGWLYTGDIAVVDEDGYFKIINRKSEIFEKDGVTIFPRDIEEVIYENNKVMEAAAIGMDDPIQIYLFVAPRPGTTITEDELMKLCKRRLEGHLIPDEIIFKPQLPKSLVGKILRRVLIDEFEKETEPDNAP